MATQATLSQTVIYPESDGTPVGETDDHREVMFEVIHMIKQLISQTVAYVAGNLFVYYEEGRPEAVVCPDVFVLFGVPQRRRRTYKSWEHGGKYPDLVIELTSAKTRYEDLGTKRVLYADLGVQEYYIFDPLGEYLQPRLRAYQLHDGELIPHSGSRIMSKLLQAELVPDGAVLRLIDLRTGERLTTPAEEAEARRTEAEARRAAEAEVARLRAEIERLKQGGAR